MNRGITFNIQRFSTEDGPGNRTTVFFMGCPLKCTWCHNPEGMKKRPFLVWNKNKCLNDLDCINACKKNCISDQFEIDGSLCDLCEECVNVCASEALEVIGQSWTIEGLVKELKKDKHYFDSSGGGVTLSGGEPLMQYDFVLELIDRLKMEKVKVALDTCGSAKNKTFIDVAKNVDLILYDLKAIDPKLHKDGTGVDNRLILENILATNDLDVPVWIRTPLIPMFTATSKNVIDIVVFIKKKLTKVERHDLLPYSNYCISKYKKFNTEYDLKDVPAMSKEELAQFVEIAFNNGLQKLYQ